MNRIEIPAHETVVRFVEFAFKQRGEYTGSELVTSFCRFAKLSSGELPWVVDRATRGPNILSAHMWAGRVLRELFPQARARKIAAYLAAV